MGTAVHWSLGNPSQKIQVQIFSMKPMSRATVPRWIGGVSLSPRVRLVVLATSKAPAVSTTSTSSSEGSKTSSTSVVTDSGYSASDISFSSSFFSLSAGLVTSAISFDWLAAHRLSALSMMACIVVLLKV